MPSLIHEIAVSRLSRDPSLLPALAERLLGRSLPPELLPSDSTLRLANPSELRPDLILARGRRGRWDAIEVQRRIDRAKARRWALLVSLLHDQRRCMGDLWVLTASRRTAEWARTACDVEGPGGTSLCVKPVVLLVGPDQVEALLDEEQPSLAFFAAWAMAGRRGPRAQRVVARALAITRRMPERLRRAQEQDIVSIMDPIDSVLARMLLEPPTEREPTWLRSLRDEIQSNARHEVILEAKREALLAVLKGRRLSLSAPQRAVIGGCADLATLDRWLAASGSVATVEELLGSAPARKKATVRAAAPVGRVARAPGKRPQRRAAR